MFFDEIDALAAARPEDGETGEGCGVRGKRWNEDGDGLEENRGEREGGGRAEVDGDPAC